MQRFKSARFPPTLLNFNNLVMFAQQVTQNSPQSIRPGSGRGMDFIEDNAPYVECCSAGEWVELYYTCISSYLTPTAGSWLAHTDTSRLHLKARGSAAPHAERFADA